MDILCSNFKHKQLISSSQSQFSIYTNTWWVAIRTNKSQLRITHKFKQAVGIASLPQHLPILVEQSLVTYSVELHSVPASIETAYNICN